ncbi:hypothetical protein D915_007034 [Fasciola hepatica]|uniref:Uncharacterized protein n=1 Tax=Fasciola hepatica TaxID=6192 RepID=A0A4E0RYQ5_FASHE|nr:hypothetical protein D915_007034 [Fasciola hepatica]
MVAPQSNRHNSHFWHATRRTFENLAYYVSQRLAGQRKSTAVTSALQQVYLENSIFLISFISLGLSVVLQMDSSFLEIRLFKLKDPCMIKDNRSTCVYKRQTYKNRPLEVLTAVPTIEGIVNHGLSRIGYQDASPELERLYRQHYAQIAERNREVNQQCLQERFAQYKYDGNNRSEITVAKWNVRESYRLVSKRLAIDEDACISMDVWMEEL